MLSTEACKKYLEGIPLSDEQVETLRDTLYALVENALDEYISSCANMQSTCKNLSYTAESLLNDKKMKDMV